MYVSFPEHLKSKGIDKNIIPALDGWLKNAGSRIAQLSYTKMSPSYSHFPDLHGRTTPALTVKESKFQHPLLKVWDGKFIVIVDTGFDRLIPIGLMSMFDLFPSMVPPESHALAIPTLVFKPGATKNHIIKNSRYSEESLREALLTLINDESTQVLYDVRTQEPIKNTPWLYPYPEEHNIETTFLVDAKAKSASISSAMLDSAMIHMRRYALSCLEGFANFTTRQKEDFVDIDVLKALLRQSSMQKGPIAKAALELLTIHHREHNSIEKPPFTVTRDSMLEKEAFIYDSVTRYIQEALIAILCIKHELKEPLTFKKDRINEHRIKSLVYASGASEYIEAMWSGVPIRDLFRSFQFDYPKLESRYAYASEEERKILSVNI